MRFRYVYAEKCFLSGKEERMEDNALVLLFSKCRTGMRESITLLLFWPKNPKVFAWFARCFLSREENPKAEAFLLGLAVFCLLWLKNYLWVLFSPILLYFLLFFVIFIFCPFSTSDLYDSLIFFLIL